MGESLRDWVKYFIEKTDKNFRVVSLFVFRIFMRRENVSWLTKRKTFLWIHDY
jgi:hypothetical protein